MSSATNARGQVQRHHSDCLRDAVGGWRVCLTAWRAGVAAAAAASDRIRVVVWEPATSGSHQDVARRLQLAAARQLWADFGVGDSLDALRALLIRRGGHKPPERMLVAIDLFVTGRVELAQWGGASVRHIAAEGRHRLLSDRVAVVDELDDEDWLAVLSASFIRLVPTGAVTGLPRSLEGAMDPCAARDQLVGRRTDGAPHTPPMVLARRGPARRSG